PRACRLRPSPWTPSRPAPRSASSPRCRRPWPGQATRTRSAVTWPLSWSTPRRPPDRGTTQPPAFRARQAAGSDFGLPRRRGQRSDPPWLADPRRSARVRRHPRGRARSRGRLATRGGAAVRAPGGVVDDRGPGDQPPEGAVGALPGRQPGRAPVRARCAARTCDRELPGAAGAVRPDPDAFAALLCDWCLEAGEGDQVLVGTSVPSMPLALAVHGALLERGAWPLVRLSAAALAESLYRHAGDEQLDGF